MRVCELLIRHGADEDLAAAGALHDVVEDTPVTLTEVRALFGDKVALLVEQASEPDRSDTWQHRKEHTIEFLREASDDLLMLSCADKFDNLTCIASDRVLLGDQVWERFNKGKDDQSWYYSELAAVFLNRVDACPPLLSRYVSLVESVFETTIGVR